MNIRSNKKKNISNSIMLVILLASAIIIEMAISPSNRHYSEATLPVTPENQEVYSIKKHFQNRELPSSVLTFGKRGQIFKSLGIDYIPSSERYYDQTKLRNQKLSLCDSKITTMKEWMNIDTKNIQIFPSSKVMKNKVINKKIPIFSISIKGEDLYDNYHGIISNPYKKGKNWERPCFVSYFNNGKLIFSSGAGLRIHGKKTRERKHKNFRVYFRNTYGKNRINPGTIFSKKAGNINRFIIKNSVNSGFCFLNPLSFDIAREIGCIAPECFPVKFYLNGEEYSHGIYFASEHLSKNYLKNHFGHKNFTIIKSKGGDFNNPDYLKLLEWANNRNHRMTLQEAKKKINIESFTLWWIATIYLGNSDPYQGMALLDKTKKDAKWFWIIWDFDHGIRNRGGNREPVSKINIWEQVSPLYRVMNNLYVPEKEVLGILFQRLMKEDLGYPLYFTSLFKQVMKEILTDEFLTSRIEYYTKIAEKFEISDKSYIQKEKLFFKNRNKFMEEILLKYLYSPEDYFVKGTNNETNKI